MKTIIVTGGNIDYDFALDFMKKNRPDCVIGADRGIEFLKKAGYTPDLIVGDFDSGNPDDLAFFKEKGVQVRTFKPQKDSTDTEIAVMMAIELGSSEIAILGGTGTRLDHVMGNIRNLSIPMKAGIPCVLVDKNNRIRMSEKPLTITKKGQYGKYVSVLAHSGKVENLCLRGFFYPLEGYTMTGNDALGISNEIVSDTAEILFDSGCVLVIESRD